MAVISDFLFVEWLKVQILHLLCVMCSVVRSTFPTCFSMKDKLGGVNELLATDTRFQDALGADSYIVDLLEKGYRLKFDNTPPPSFTRNNKSVLQNQDFCSQGASQT